jgi:competence protein ComEA
MKKPTNNIIGGFMKDKKKLISIGIFSLTLLIIFVISLSLNGDNRESNKIVLAKNDNDGMIRIEHLKVDIKGAVKNPGVYEVEMGNRVIDLIEKAGGLLKGANTDYINLSKVLSDEMIIWIYTDSEIEKLKLGNTIIEYIEKECNCPSVSNTACINNSSSLININTADLNLLMTLSGIGESKAKAIIDYREKNSFKSIEDIMNVSGIGESAFVKIKDFITI